MIVCTKALQSGGGPDGHANFYKTMYVKGFNRIARQRLDGSSGRLSDESDECRTEVS